MPKLGLLNQLPALFRLLHDDRVFDAVVQKVGAQERQANVLQNGLKLFLPRVEVVRRPLLDGQEDALFLVDAEVVF